MLLPRDQIVVTSGNAITVRDAVIDQGRHICPSHSGAAGAARAVRTIRIRRERDRQVSPVHKIVGDSVTPMNRPPKRTVRIVLIEQMKTAVPEDRAVRIVHPICRRQKVVERTMGIGGQLQSTGVNNLPRFFCDFHIIHNPLMSRRHSQLD